VEYTRRSLGAVRSTDSRPRWTADYFCGSCDALDAVAAGPVR